MTARKLVQGFITTCLILTTASTPAQTPASRNTSAPAGQPAAQAAPTSNAAPLDLVGAWQGTLEVGVSLRLVVRIQRNDKGELSAVMDSPDQGANGLAVSKITFEDGKLLVESSAVHGTFEGTYKSADVAFEGTWKQNGLNLPLTLKKLDKEPVYSRPQEPKKPYPYKAEEVSVPNPAAAGVTLAGTLTMPEGSGPFPAVVLVTGSGPQDRDEALMGHKPFLVLADHLTRKGVAVLRCDDRGIGKSTGSFATATSEDFATDALAAVAFLKQRSDIDAKHIGICGHSEGGLIAPLCAAKSADVGFIVMMAGPGVPGDEILFAQGELIARAQGAPDEAVARQRKFQKVCFDVIKSEPDAEKAAEKLRTELKALTAAMTEQEKREAGGDTDAFIETQIKSVNSPWFRAFIKYDPRPTLAKVKCPVLAINGEKDLQVPPKQSLPEVEKALKSGGNTHVTIRELPGLNHLFQTAKTGGVTEYSQIEETMSPTALDAISDWILKNCKS